MATCGTWNGDTTDMLCPALWLKQRKTFTIPFLSALQAFGPGSLKEDGLF